MGSGQRQTCRQLGHCRLRDQAQRQVGEDVQGAGSHHGRLHRCQHQSVRAGTRQGCRRNRVASTAGWGTPRWTHLHGGGAAGGGGAGPQPPELLRGQRQPRLLPHVVPHAAPPLLLVHRHHLPLHVPRPGVRHDRVATCGKLPKRRRHEQLLHDTPPSGNQLRGHQASPKSRVTLQKACMLSPRTRSTAMRAPTAACRTAWQLVTT